MYLITHADRFNGYDPVHTPEGIETLKEILAVPVSTIVYGTGKRFREIAEIVRETNPNAKMVPTPLCGGPEGLDPDGHVVLSDGTKIPLQEYEGLEANKEFPDLWEFIETFPEDTVFCAGGELMIALGLNAKRERGTLYVVHLEHKDVSKIT